MPPMHDASERLFLDHVKQLARMNGWLLHHPTAYQVRPGAWRSDDKGVPDLLLVSRHNRGIIHAELKTMRGRMTEEQEEWGASIVRNGGEFHLWRPDMLEDIARRLGAVR